MNNVEGYFIYIRPSSKNPEPFKKVTIIGHASHSYAFEKLESGKAYEIKVEAFNFSGGSPSSKIVRQRTLKSKTVPIEPSHNFTSSKVQEKSSTETETVLDNEEVTLYLILAGISVGFVLVLVICCSVWSCLRRDRNRKSYSNSNVAIHEKYMDTSRQISLKNSQTLHSGVRTPMYQNSDQQLYASNSQTAETSFSSPNRLSQFINNSSLIASSSPLTVSQVRIPNHRSNS